MIKQMFRTFFERYNKKRLECFLRSLSGNEKIVDIGCGPRTADLVKSISPNHTYTGIDITEIRKTTIDKMYVFKPETFADELLSLNEQFDVIISSHNLEHCRDRETIIKGLDRVSRPGTNLYLSTPSEKSLTNPKRAGCLNYYDDPTHLYKPVNFQWLLHELNIAGFDITYANPSYRPLIPSAIGLLLEPISAYRQNTQLGTWQLWGFEAIVWAKKR